MDPGSACERTMKRPDRRTRAQHAAKKAVTRITGMPAVAALFSVAPDRVERLFFEERARSKASSFCAQLARAHKPFRLVESSELERIAGTLLHGGIVAIARPRPVRAFDPDETRSWARDGQ